jgi:molybdopterin-guanine dinucleotide biosynthesis protein A
MLRKQSPVGVILAGGRGMRMGGSKMTVALKGRALLDYPLQAMRAAVPDVAVVAKPGVELPELTGVMLWIEPQEPHYPLLGVVEALALTAGRRVLVCPADLPFVTPRLLTRLASADPEGAPATIAACQGRIQPLLGCFEPEAAGLIAEAAYRAEDPVQKVITGIGPKWLEVEDPDELFNVNCPDDLLLAAAMLDRPSQVTRT